MAEVTVQAQQAVYGLRFGDRTKVERTPLVDKLIEAGRLAEIAPAGAAADAGASVALTKPTGLSAAQ